MALKLTKQVPSKGFLKDFMTKALIGAGLGAAADAGTELFRVPVLNDSGTFGNTEISNFELAGYGLGVAGTVAGIADIAIGKGVVTFTAATWPIFLGWMLGIYFYEHTFADMMGIRKTNIYEYAGGLIPPVLPSGTDLPFLEVPTAPTPM